MYIKKTSIIILIAAMVAAFFPLCANAEGISFSVQSSDLSWNYLRAIFGTVEGVFVGRGGQLLGTIFRYFNGALLAIAGFILAFVIIKSVITAANTGQFLDQQTSFWMPIRSVLGIILLIPNASGYCLLQKLFLMAIIAGIGLANSVFIEVLDYIGRGGVLMSTTKQTVTFTQESNITGGAQSLLDLQKHYAASYLTTAACMQALEKELKENAKDDSDKIVPSFSATIDFSTENMGKRIYFPGEFSKSYQAYTDAYKGVCGYIKLISTTNDTADAIKSLANEALYNAMDSIAEDYAIDNYAAITGEDDSIKDATIEFHYILNTGIQYLGKDVSSSLTAVFNKAKKDGWITMGNYYHKLTRVDKKAVSMNESLKSVKFTPGSLPIKLKNITYDSSAPYLVQLNSQDIKTIIDNVDKSNSNLKNYIYKKALPNVTFGPETDISDISGGTVTEAWGKTLIIALAGSILVIITLSGILLWGQYFPLLIPIFGWPLSKIAWGFIDILYNTDVSPIVGIARVGWGLMDLGVTIWLMGTYVIGVVGIAASIISMFNPLPFSIMQILQWFMPMLTLLTTALTTAGATFMIYIPLIPFIIFLFGVIGWFFAVIEAMVAAPLVALGLMIPAGDPIFGKSQGAIFILMNVVFRPVLMVIGFMLASMLLFIFVWMFNKAFWIGVVESVFADPLQYGGVSIVLVFPMLIIIYGMIILYITQEAFTLIHIIPDKVFRYIGVAAETWGEKGAQVAGKLEAGIRAGAGEIAGAGKGMLQASVGQAGAMEQKGETKGKEDRAEKKANAEKADKSVSLQAGPDSSGGSGGGGSGGSTPK